MKQEDKDLLLKDLCGRLPYKVKVTTTNEAVKFGVISGISIENKISVRTKHADIIFGCTEVKPYLFPLSSMTEEQKYICPIGVGNLETFIEKESWAYLELSFDSILRFIDWLNKNHFDYRGLIPMGLANNATGLNIY